jgi:hypothetical protein
VLKSVPIVTPPTLPASILLLKRLPDLAVVVIALRRFAPLKTREAGVSIKPDVTSVPDF